MSSAFSTIVFDKNILARQVATSRVWSNSIVKNGIDADLNIKEELL